MNAEISMSEFVSKTLPAAATKNKKEDTGVKNPQIASIIAGVTDTSDFLYNASAEAQKPKVLVKKIRRLKSQSPNRPGKT